MHLEGPQKEHTTVCGKSYQKWNVVETMGFGQDSQSISQLLTKVFN